MLLAPPQFTKNLSLQLPIDFLLLLINVGISNVLIQEKLRESFGQAEKPSAWILLCCVAVLAIMVPAVPKTEYNARISSMGKGGELAPGNFAGVKAFKINNVGSRFAYSSDGSMYSSTMLNQADPRLAIFDADTNRRIRLINQEKEVSSVTFSPDSRYLVTGMITKPANPNYSGFEVWEVETGNRIDRFATSSGWTRTFIPDIKRDNVLSVEFSPDGKYIMSNYREIWRFDSGQLIAKLTGPAWWEWLGSSHLLQKQKNQISIVDVETRKEVVLVKEEDEKNREWTNILSASADGRMFAVCVTNSALKREEVDVWEVEPLKKVITIPTTSWSGSVVITLSPDGRFLAFGVMEEAVVTNKIELWDIKRGEKVKMLEHPGHGIKQIAFRQDSKRFAVLAGDMIAFFDVETK
jgi:WD40 repeat protein